MELTKSEIAKQTLTHKIDELESVMLDNFPIVDCPVTHHHSDGMYVREIFLPKDTLVTSKIHKTQHPFFLMKGKCMVWIDGAEQIIEAPFIGITQPDTRRVVYALENSIWATSHSVSNDETLEQIEERIIESHENPHISLEIKNRLNNLLNK